MDEKGSRLLPFFNGVKKKKKRGKEISPSFSLLLSIEKEREKKGAWGRGSSLSPLLGRGKALFTRKDCIEGRGKEKKKLRGEERKAFINYLTTA